MRDLIARDATRVAIRRDLDVEADTTVPDVDLDTEGAAIASQPLTLDGAAANDQRESYLSWETAHGWVGFLVDGDQLRQPPASLIAPADRFSLYVKTSGADERGAFATRDGRLDAAAGQPITVALPPRLDATLVESDHDAHVELHASPGDGELYLGVDADGEEEILRLSPSWVAAHHPTALVFDLSAPGADAFAIDFAHAAVTTLFFNAYEVDASSTWELALQQSFP
jgi:hypothetical protein